MTAGAERDTSRDICPRVVGLTKQRDVLWYPTFCCYRVSQISTGDLSSCPSPDCVHLPLLLFFRYGVGNTEKRQEQVVIARVMPLI